MPDLEPLREALLAQHPQAWVEHLLNSFHESYFATFDRDAIDRQLTLMRRLGDNHPVALEARPGDLPGEWWIEVVGYDAFQFLSTLCMLLSVYGLSIQEAWIFTSEPPVEAVSSSLAPVGGGRRVPASRPRLGRPPRPGSHDRPDRRRKLVDVLLVRQVGAAGPPPDWPAFLCELTTLVQLLHDNRYDQVFHRLLRRFVARLAPQDADDLRAEGLSIEIDPDVSPFATVVKVEGRDSFGFLSLTASALSLCGIRIVQADVRTPGRGRVDDRFWVTDRAGRKITSEPRVRELRLSLILIEHFSRRLPHAANPESALTHFSRFANDVMTRPDWATEFQAIDQPEVLDALVRVLGESEFLWEDYLRDQPGVVLPIISDPARWESAPTSEALVGELEGRLAAAPDPESRRLAIRQFKAQEIFRAGLRAILGKSGGREAFSRELTAAAEVVMRGTYIEALDGAARAIYRAPEPPPAPSVLCALGKFGGRELGFGSDLELMLIFDDAACPADTTCGEFFDQVIRELKGVLAIRIGGTFELDFRLRPYGKGGPPATSWATFSTYFHPAGPAWGYERQALIKLRVLAGDPDLDARVLEHRDRYVYGPEPFDREGGRRMREMQIRQLVRPGTVNAKFSPGALVDIEYFVQERQITCGGTDRSLRSTNTLEALAALEAAGHVAPADAEVLRGAYRFFRNLVDALRVVHGHAKDLTVPSYDSDAFALLSRRMLYARPEDLAADLRSHQQAVRRVVEPPA